ncbi:MAG TPA: hypothetical protein VJ994_06035 [Paracoccaceae bacterium]|nr:hypothetical protein [Paracoccaceae bacterium]
MRPEAEPAELRQDRLEALGREALRAGDARGAVQDGAPVLFGEAFGVTAAPPLDLLEGCADSEGGLRDVVNTLRRAWEIAFAHGRPVAHEDVAAAVVDRAPPDDATAGGR